MQFEWDPEKASANESAHGVSFLEASEVFDDDHSSTVPDPDHSEEENRYLIFGCSNLEEQLSERHGQRLEEVREQLLQLLAAQTNRITASQAAQALQISEQLAMYHLTEMEKGALVSATHFYTGRPTDYLIAQAGRAYLVSHGLLR